RVRKDRYTPDLRDGILEQRQVLGEDLRVEAIGHPGDIPAGARDARDEPEADRIRQAHSHDRDRGRGFLRCQGRRRRGRGDDVHLQPYELGGQRRESLEVPIRPSILDHDVLTLDPPEVAQPLSERVDGRRVWSPWAGREISDLKDLSGRLRPNSW